MKKFRFWLTVAMIVLACMTSLLSVIFAILVVDRQFLEREEVRYMMFGLAAGDLLLLLLIVTALATGFVFVMRSMLRPIVEMERAISKVTAGDYNVRVRTSGWPGEIGELLQKFNLMVEQLRSNEFLHKDFTSNISHEFKTPLAIINGYADLLEEGELSDEERRDYANHISRESKRLSTLTADLLRMSSLDNEKPRGRKTRFLLDEQIRQAVLNMEAKWEEKGISIELDLKELYFTGDEELINIVWSNLINNAIKFTEPGGSISITARKGYDRLTVIITDTGIGMDEETIKHIYEQFYRGRTDGKYEGSGLGLSIVQRIVLLHEGHIAVESMPGEGSRFIVTLPIKNYN